jgi:hypothetical protein
LRRNAQGLGALAIVQTNDAVSIEIHAGENVTATRQGLAPHDASELGRSEPRVTVQIEARKARGCHRRDLGARDLPVVISIEALKPRRDFTSDTRRDERFELRTGDARIAVRVRCPDELRVLDLRCVGRPTELGQGRDLGDAPRWIRMDPSRADDSAQTDEDNDDGANANGSRKQPLL